MVTTENYGSWNSPITSDSIVESTVRLLDVQFDGDSIYWLESRPQESGRSVIVRKDPNSEPQDLAAPPWNTRTRVHEYGGGAFLVDSGEVYGSNFSDQQLYRYAPQTEPVPITKPGPFRYADACMDRERNRLICIRESHENPEAEARNAVVSVALDGSGAVEVLAEGYDFFSSPCINPQGTELVWLSWDHPNMPWDGTTLWKASIQKDGSLGPKKQVAGGMDESIFQPQWSPEGVLYFISDKSGWWNLYRFGGEVHQVLARDAEFGAPQWVFGMSTYAFISEKTIACTYFDGKGWQLATVDTEQGSLTDLKTEYSVIRQLRAQGSKLAFVGASPSRMPEILTFDLETGQASVLKQTTAMQMDTGYLSIPEAISFPTEDGEEAHAYLYRPKNKDYQGPENEHPPLVVFSHGGPTGATSPELNLGKQFWTSRGFAILDVNYGGSTGYGRSYRERLRGQWGIVDVNDCSAGAMFLVEKGEVDPNRLAIRGGSAGGYTTLAALAFKDVFHAGASYFGVSDPEALAKDTHKFESRYLDGLIGPYPEAKDLYTERAPIHAIDQLNCPIVFFQGLEDKVVPPNQAEMMVDALREKGLPVAYVPYEGEQHGFRNAKNIKHSLDAELYFYAQVMRFSSIPDEGRIQIENLDV